MLGGMFICLLVLMIALDCYVYCDNFNRRSILETTYEYCYTYRGGAGGRHPGLR